MAVGMGLVTNGIGCGMRCDRKWDETREGMELELGMGCGDSVGRDRKGGRSRVGMGGSGM